MAPSITQQEIVSSFPEVSGSRADLVVEILNDSDLVGPAKLEMVSNLLPSRGVEVIGLYVGGQPVGLYVDTGNDFADTLVYDVLRDEIILTPWRTFLAHWSAPVEQEVA